MIAVRNETRQQRRIAARQGWLNRWNRAAGVMPADKSPTLAAPDGPSIEAASLNLQEALDEISDDDLITSAQVKAHPNSAAYSTITMRVEVPVFPGPFNPSCT